MRIIATVRPGGSTLIMHAQRSYALGSYAGGAPRPEITPARRTLDTACAVRTSLANGDGEGENRTPCCVRPQPRAFARRGARAPTGSGMLHI